MLVRPAFLSSVFQDLAELRRRLYEERFPNLWVAEIDREDLAPALNEPLTIVDQLVEQLQRSEVFICILAGERTEENQTGTRIAVRDRPSLVSYFEIEVFQAALHQIPAVFLARQDFAPGAELEEFLQILSGSAVIERWVKGLNEKQISEEVRCAIESRHALKRAAINRRRSAAGDLATELLTRRSHLAAVRSGGSDMLWLQGRMIRARGGPRSLDEAERLLAEAAKETRHNHRLSRLYIVLRELMSHPYDKTTDSAVLKLWNSAFDMWWGSAAWYGLHNHLAMGVIAALWSQREVRRRLLASSSTGGHDDLRAPYGPLASAYFSLGKILPSRWRQWQISGVGIYLANKRIRSGAERDPTIYAVRGSLFFLRRNPLRGMMDYHHLLKLARNQPDNLSLNAEAHTYMGRGYSLLRLNRLASPHLQAAVRLCRENANADGHGREFLIKALKHLLELQIRLDHRDEAVETASEALRLCEEFSVMDQAFQIETMLAKAHLHDLEC